MMVIMVMMGPAPAGKEYCGASNYCSDPLCERTSFEIRRGETAVKGAEATLSRRLFTLGVSAPPFIFCLQRIFIELLSGFYYAVSESFALCCCPSSSNCESCLTARWPVSRPNPSRCLLLVGPPEMDCFSFLRGDTWPCRELTLVADQP